MQWISKAEETHRRSRNAAIAVGRYWRKMNLIGRHQGSSSNRRPGAGRRFNAVLDPRNQILQKRAYRPGMGIRIRLLLACAKRLLGGKRQRRRGMLRRGHEIAAHVSGLGQITNAKRIGKAK